jgi:hypothetical protein
MSHARRLKMRRCRSIVAVGSRGKTTVESLSASRSTGFWMVIGPILGAAPGKKRAEVRIAG